MALTNQPYLPLYVDDYLTDEKLLMCEFSSQGIYARLMCHFHKSKDYGKLIISDFEKAKLKLNASKIKAEINFSFLNINEDIFCMYILKIQKLINIDIAGLSEALIDLIGNEVLHLSDGVLWQKRMVEDGKKSAFKSLNGKKGGRENKQNKSEIESKRKAKRKQIPVNVNVNVNEYENINENENENENDEKEKGGVGEKEKTSKIPNLEEFEKYALEQKPDVDIEAVRLKFRAWQENNWQTSGKNAHKIENWKATLCNTLKFLENEKTLTVVHSKREHLPKVQLNAPNPNRIMANPP